MQAAAVEVVLPLFRAMVDAAESIILKLHEVCPGRPACLIMPGCTFWRDIGLHATMLFREVYVGCMAAGGRLGRRHAKGPGLGRRAARLPVHGRADTPPGALPVSPHVPHLPAYASCKASQ